MSTLDKILLILLMAAPYVQYIYRAVKRDTREELMQDGETSPYIRYPKAW